MKEIDRLFAIIPKDQRNEWNILTTDSWHRLEDYDIQMLASIQRDLTLKQVAEWIHNWPPTADADRMADFLAIICRINAMNEFREDLLQAETEAENERD